MHPILFEIGPIKIFTYGFLLALGFLSAIFVAGREARRLGIPPGKFFDLCFYIILAALVGSRLLYVLLELRTFIAHPLKIFALWEGGLVFQGGVILAFLVAVYYIRRHGLPWRATLDALGLGTPLGQFFGRLGCFMAGCCWGSPADLPWSVVFSNPDTLCPLREPLHPAQLYEAASGPGGLRVPLLVQNPQALRRPVDSDVLLPGGPGALYRGVFPEPPGLPGPGLFRLDAHDPAPGPGPVPGLRRPAALLELSGPAPPGAELMGFWVLVKIS